MGINITILVQMINFVIAYVIIRTLLLKPTVAVILEEQDVRTRLDESIQNVARANKAKEETMTRNWADCKQEFGKRAPHVAQTEQMLRTEHVEAVPEVPLIDKKAIDPMADRLADELVERIGHVR